MKTSSLALSLLAATGLAAQDSAALKRPNVVLVMTDDQGFGDFGFAGDPAIRTPNLDALAARSAQLQNFYVSPVCTPTRSALVTGRWSQRTRAFDTYIGRAMMEPEEVTVAEVLRDAGYATGIFGKWHLGDCYPMRAIDQGFEEALVIRGGGIGQPSDPPGGEGKYTDPVLFRNGVREEQEGYCTDVYFREALAWMRSCRAAGRPFFCYVPTNAPHGPFHDVPEELLARYRGEDLSPGRYPGGEGHPLPEKWDQDRLARIFAMIENVDQNIGRLVEGLRAMDCLDDTLLLFLVDNGPNTRRYVRGHRGMKSEVYEGGIRAPLLAHWPARLEPGVASDRIAAHVDLMPTILESCGVPVPDGLALDGRSVLPLLDRRSDADWADRVLVIQANRGDAPVPFHNVAVRTQDWKLINASGFGREVDAVDKRFELYDMRVDPFELHDLAADRPEVVASLVAAYDGWWRSIQATRPDPFAPPRIFVGSAAEPVTTLTRQDWRRDDRERGWGSRGTWLVDVRRPGNYAVWLRLPKGRKGRLVTFRCGEVEKQVEIPPVVAEYGFEVQLRAGPAALRTSLEDQDGRYGAHQVELRRLGD